MREIVFRGKHKTSGKWCEGNLHVDKQGVAIITPDDTPLGSYGQVDPDTVGQYTGLVDKNGVRIYEGDILQVEGFNGGMSRCVIGFGIFPVYGSGSVTEVGFYLCWETDKGQYQKYANLVYWLQNREAVCVGNVHDNPELMSK